jgi:hypothetical protein
MLALKSCSTVTIKSEEDDVLLQRSRKIRSGCSASKLDIVVDSHQSDRFRSVDMDGDTVGVSLSRIIISKYALGVTHNPVKTPMKVRLGQPSKRSHIFQLRHLLSRLQISQLLAHCINLTSLWSMGGQVRSTPFASSVASGLGFRGGGKELYVCSAGQSCWAGWSAVDVCGKDAVDECAVCGWVGG